MFDGSDPVLTFSSGSKKKRKKKRWRGNLAATRGIPRERKDNRTKIFLVLEP